MKRLLRTASTVFLLATTLSASAHEFWFWPSSFTPPSGSVVRLSLHVGQYFEGILTGFGMNQAVALREYSAGPTLDLIKQVPQQDQADFPARVRGAGTHVFAYDSQTNLITLPADKFNDYLHDEGLDAIVTQREAAGTAATPGRERFRRNVKTIVSVGGKSDASFGVRTGQRLEILPLTDPLANSVNDPLRFRLLFDDKPLVNGLVRAWHRRGGQTVMIRVRSDAQGELTLTLPYGGPWMLSLVHMIAATDTTETDWDSYWGNLTFALPVKRAGR